MYFDINDSEYEKFIKPNEDKLICFSNEEYVNLISVLLEKMLEADILNLEILVSDIDSHNRNVAMKMASDIYIERVKNGVMKKASNEDELDYILSDISESEILSMYFSDDVLGDIENMVYIALSTRFRNVSLCLEGETAFDYPVFMTRFNEDILSYQYYLIPQTGFGVADNYTRDCKFIINSTQTTLPLFDVPIIKYGNNYLLAESNESKQFSLEQSEEQSEKLRIG